MDKKTAHYNLKEIKKWVISSNFKFTKSALKGAQGLGIISKEMRDSLITIESHHFYKSMTSYNNPNIWQDVYHLPYKNITIYIKFTEDILTDFRLLSFKEK